MKITNFADLMNGHQTAEIYCLYSGKLARRLTVEGNRVIIDATQPPIVSAFLTATIWLKPWVMDRGNLVFECPEIEGGIAKICGEGDTIRYPDGTEDTIYVDE